MALLLGLDVGSSRVKAVLLARDGRELRAATAPTPFEQTPAGTEAPAPALLEAVRAVLEQLGRDRERVAAVGLAGMAECGAPLGPDGGPAAPVIAWHDQRGQEVVDHLVARFGEWLPSRTGQQVRIVSTVAKLGWLVTGGAGPVEAWLGVPELCLWRLTGARATEHSLAVRTGCYDLPRRRFLPEVAEAAGFPPSVFPQVLAAGSVMGRVSAGGSRWSALPEGVPVTIAGHDHLAGAAGVGAGPDDLLNSVGTAETMLRAVPALPDLPRAVELGLAVSIRPGGEGWIVLAGAARSGIVLDTAAAALGSPVAALDVLAGEAAAPLDGPALLESAAAGGPVVPGGPPGAVWLGLYGALAARTAEAAERLESLCAGLAGPARRIVMFGGGSLSRPWAAAKARALPLPLFRPQTAEAAARGAAVMAGVAAGWWRSAAEAPRPGLEPVATSGTRLEAVGEQ